MKKAPYILLLLLCVLSGCRGRRGYPGESQPAPAADSATVFVPVFSSTSIPDSVAARMRGVSYPADAEIRLVELRYLQLSYIDFEGCPQVGEMVCNQAVAEDLVAIFRALYDARYPIRSMRLIDDFDGDDEASMEADNTSCFNYRRKTGMKSLSKHALGLAVDVNPLENPYVRGAGRQCVVRFLAEKNFCGNSIARIIPSTMAIATLAAVKPVVLESSIWLEIR